MGYDYSKKLMAEGQQHSNACWAASISWWMSAMCLHNKRFPYSQTNLLMDFNEFAIIGGSVQTTGIRKICESARIRMELKFIPPTNLNDNNIETPCVVIFKYAEAGGTHMNVIFDRQGDTVMCMEPFFPLKALRMGDRTGTYVRRSLSFFNKTPEIGFGYLPMKDSLNGTEEAK